LHEFIDAGEFGLSLEQMAGVLAKAATPLSDRERHNLLALVQMMGINDRVPRALDFCPPAE
jgi:hypothetical protein